MIHEFHVKADTERYADRLFVGPIGYYAAVELIVEHPTTGALTRFRFRVFAEDEIGLGCIELPWPLEIEDAGDTATILDWKVGPLDWEKDAR